MKFRTRVREIEAIQVTSDNHDEVVAFVEGTEKQFDVLFSVLSFQGPYNEWVEVRVGNWVTKTPGGLVGVLTDNDLRHGYELAEEGPMKSI